MELHIDFDAPLEGEARNAKIKELASQHVSFFTHLRPASLTFLPFHASKAIRFGPLRGKASAIPLPTDPLTHTQHSPSSSSAAMDSPPSQPRSSISATCPASPSARPTSSARSL